MTMAAFMIFRYFRKKKDFIIGLSVYAAGAIVGAFAPVLGVLIFGYSILEGLGTALLIPPVYILIESPPTEESHSIKGILYEAKYSKHS
jgi:MFS family permease